MIEKALLAMSVPWFCIALFGLLVTIRAKHNRTLIPARKLFKQVAFSVIAIALSLGKTAYLAAALWAGSLIVLLFVIYLVERQRKKVLSAWG